MMAIVVALVIAACDLVYAISLVLVALGLMGNDQ